MNRAYRRQPDGPDPMQAFTVLRGFVVLYAEVPLVIPAGGTWPGPELDPALAELGWPATSAQLPGTEISPHTTPAGIEAGQALVLAQLLSRPVLADRLALALEAGAALDLVPRQLAAALIHTSREQITKLFAAAQGAAAD